MPCNYIRVMVFKCMPLRLSLIILLLLLLSGPYCRGQQNATSANSTYSDNNRLITSPFFLERPMNRNDSNKAAALLKDWLKRGQNLAREGKYNEAMFLFRNMLLHTWPNAPYRLNIYSEMVNLLENSGNYQEALQAYYLALAQTNDVHTQAKLYVNISGLYIALKDYDKAMTSLNKAIHLLANDNEGAYWITLALCNKGAVYNARNAYDSAVIVFRKAYETIRAIPPGQHALDKKHKEINDTKNLVLNNLADTYIKLNAPDSALHYLQMILPDLKELSEYTQCAVLVTLGQVYSLKNENKPAVKYLTQGLKVGLHAGYQILNKEAYESLAIVNSRMGNYEAAWKYQKEYTKIKDNLISIENIHKINSLERQYDLSKRDKELARKELLINKQANRLKEQNWLAGILILTVLSLVSIFLVFRKSHFNKQKLLKEQLNSSIKDHKIMQIEAGMKGEEKERTRLARDLHDGVVSEMLAMKLNLQAMENKHAELRQSHDYKNIIYQAEEVTEKLRMAAHNLMPANVREQGLIQTIHAFLNRINNHKLQFTFLHYGDIPDLNDVTVKIILMMTMELIQNILKHASATEAMIQFNFFDDNMSITVEDNGVGIAPNLANIKGMGLTNIENNVQVLNGTLDIKSSEYTGTTMLIEIPLSAHTLNTA